ncbi:MAG: hypothetical protein JXR96_19070 [Deltaproteobacteria bacterium]|nr:hypothetical protein [Deltaproteobacteria bacterium]
MWRWIFKMVILLPFRHHFFGSFAIVLGVSWVISAQITDRFHFADSELHQDVIERWGAPIVQPVPSVRFVPSGSVFNTLEPMPIRRQDVEVKAEMNYRKRGLVYFSGFDFAFQAQYEVENDRGRDIDLVFVFPIQMKKNQVLLSDLAFTVNGKPAPLDLSGEKDKLVWTGRARPGEKLKYEIAFKGRGLDSFVYRLDPAMRVHDFHMAMHVTGGVNFDYPPNVAPSSEVQVGQDGVSMRWAYASLESGVPVGLILPSEQAFDDTLATMIRRSWAPFILFFAGLVGLCLFYRKTLKVYEAYLVAACYGLFFVLAAYLAAFMSFYLAYALSLAAVLVMLFFYLASSLSARAGLQGLALAGAFLLVPTLAVILDGYTGLIYTLEIAVGLAFMMFLTSRKAFRSLFEEVVDSLAVGRRPAADAAASAEGSHA